MGEARCGGRWTSENLDRKNAGNRHAGDPTELGIGISHSTRMCTCSFAYLIKSQTRPSASGPRIFAGCPVRHGQWGNDAPRSAPRGESRHTAPLRAVIRPLAQRS